MRVASYLKFLVFLIDGIHRPSFFPKLVAHSIIIHSNKISNLSMKIGLPKIFSAPTDGVLVVGATGRIGREVMRTLLESGRNVVAAGKDSKKLKETAKEFGKFDNFWIRENIFLTAGKDLPASSFEGISQVVSCIGPSFKDPNFDSKSVDFEANLSLLSSLKKAGVEKRSRSGGKEFELVNYDQSSQGSKKRKPPHWTRLDDVIMGGKSSSFWRDQNDNENFKRWFGQLKVEGGGFCGTIIKDMDFDLSGYDGVRLMVRGDGNRYKFRIKPITPAFENEFLYQASFDTVKDGWIEVKLPFESFTAVKRSDVLYDAPCVSERPKITSIGIILSRFEYNSLENPKCQPGDFALDLQYIGLYRSKRPALVMISSAASERFNRISEEQRKMDVPIVKLNPQGVLNWKYKAETEIRKSGVPYAIVRPVGLIPEENAGGVRGVRFEQMDELSGCITREELSKVILHCLEEPEFEGKTFEVRRDEAEIAKDQLNRKNIMREVKLLVNDRDRSVNGMLPFPFPKDLPKELSEDEVKQILQDPRVVAQQKRDSKGPE